MAVAIFVSVTDQAINSAELLSAFEAEASDDDGAIASFFGRCRSEDGALAALELEHYPGMAERAIGAICQQAAERWPITRLNVTHRYGLVKPQETIVAVMAASAHREAAIQTVAFIMDFLKTDAPFWKREHLSDGTVGEWIQAKSSDDEKRAAWHAS
ncbi:MAG: molybdenum cofactor biosynthesis protein MoaE [Pseudomonadota bacterium]